MKLRRGWILAIAVVCLLWSLNPAANFDKHLLAWSAESCSPSSYPSPPVLSQDCIRSRESPKLFLTPGVLLRTKDLGPEGPPWLQLRGPPGKILGPGATWWVVGRESRDRGPPEWGKLPQTTRSPPIFPATSHLKSKSGVLQQPLASRPVFQKKRGCLGDQ